MDMPKPKIMHIIDRSISGGGAETILYHNTRLLTDQFDFHIVNLGEKGGNSERYASLGVPVYELGEKYKGKWNPFSVVEIVRIIKNEDIDLLHTWLFKSHILGMLVAKLMGVKILINDRTVILPDNLRQNLTHYFGSPLFIELYSLLYRIVVKFADKIVVLTKEVMERYIHEYHLPPEKLAVLPNGIDQDGFLSKLNQREGINLRNEIGVDGEGKLVVMIGRLVSEKDWITFIKVAEKVKQVSDRNINFLIVGSGPDELALRNMVNELNLENVRFLGYRDDIPVILQQSDVMVLTSRIESFGTVILEAMLAGCPVVATQISGPASILTHEIDGLLVPVGDVEGFSSQILHLLNDDVFCSGIVQNARQTVQANYELKVVAAHLAAFYYDLLNNPRDESPA